MLTYSQQFAVPWKSLANSRACGGLLVSLRWRVVSEGLVVSASSKRAGMENPKHRCIYCPATLLPCCSTTLLPYCYPTPALLLPYYYPTTTTAATTATALLLPLPCFCQCPATALLLPCYCLLLCCPAALLLCCYPTTALLLPLLPLLPPLPLLVVYCSH